MQEPSFVGCGRLPAGRAGLSVVLAARLLTTGYFSSSYHAAEEHRAERHAERVRAQVAAGDPGGSIDEYREALTYSRDNLEYRRDSTPAPPRTLDA